MPDTFFWHPNENLRTPTLRPQSRRELVVSPTDQLHHVLPPRRDRIVQKSEPALAKAGDKTLNIPKISLHDSIRRVLTCPPLADLRRDILHGRSEGRFFRMVRAISPQRESEHDATRFRDEAHDPEQSRGVMQRWGCLHFDRSENGWKGIGSAAGSQKVLGGARGVATAP